MFSKFLLSVSFLFILLRSCSGEEDEEFNGWNTRQNIGRDVSYDQDSLPPGGIQQLYPQAERDDDDNYPLMDTRPTMSRNSYRPSQVSSRRWNDNSNSNPSEETSGGGYRGVRLPQRIYPNTQGANQESDESYSDRTVTRQQGNNQDNQGVNPTWVNEYYDEGDYDRNTDVIVQSTVGSQESIPGWNVGSDNTHAAKKTVAAVQRPVDPYNQEYDQGSIGGRVDTIRQDEMYDADSSDSGEDYEHRETYSPVGGANIGILNPRITDETMALPSQPIQSQTYPNPFYASNENQYDNSGFQSSEEADRNIEDNGNNNSPLTQNDTGDVVRTVQGTTQTYSPPGATVLDNESSDEDIDRRDNNQGDRSNEDYRRGGNEDETMDDVPNQPTQSQIYPNPYYYSNQPVYDNDSDESSEDEDVDLRGNKEGDRVWSNRVAQNAGNAGNDASDDGSSEENGKGRVNSDEDARDTDMHMIGSDETSSSSDGDSGRNVYDDDGAANSYEVGDTENTGGDSGSRTGNYRSDAYQDSGEDTSEDKDSLNGEILSEEERGDGPRGADSSEEEYSPNHGTSSSEEQHGYGEKSSDEDGNESDSNENGEHGDDSDDNSGGDSSDVITCSTNDIGRCLGKLAQYNPQTFSTQLYSTTDELCRDVERMRRCFSERRNVCTSEVLYGVEELDRSTQYICEKKEDFEEVYKCLTEASGIYSKCYISQVVTEKDSSLIQRKCRPVENFEECVSTVTASECGNKAGESVRNYYGNSRLNPRLTVETDMACPFIEALEEPALTEETKTALALGLTLAGCAVIGGAVIASAIIGAKKRTQMQQYILDEP